MSPPWMFRAACRGLDPDLFHPGQGEDTEVPKAVCHDCTVREECLEHAIANGEKLGVWGGEDARGRRRIIKQRRNGYGRSDDTGRGGRADQRSVQGVRVPQRRR